MAAVEESIEISRRPEDVFAYATDFSRYHEWQGSVVAAHWDGDTSPGAGAKATVTRRIGRRESTETAALLEKRRLTSL